MADFMDELLRNFGGGASKPEPKPEKGVQIRGRSIDGVQYVRADDIAALLEANDVLPRTAKILRGKKP